MKVIFTEDVRGRGQRGQIKEVPDGYAQNYLIKRGLAKQATKAAMSQLKGQQRAEEKHAAEELADAEAMNKILEDDNTVVELSGKAGTDGRMFGSYEQNKLQLLYKNNLTLKLISERLSWQPQLRRLVTLTCQSSFTRK